MQKHTYEQYQALASHHGDAFYLVDMAVFRDNFTSFRAAFQSHYPNTQLGYSYKTNYLPAFCEEVQRLDGYAEVVSGMEYRLARKIGVAGKDIIFNGPYKLPDALELALTEGATVNIDSLEEVEQVIAFRRALTWEPGAPTFRVCMRCHPGLDGVGETRFGVDVEAGELKAALTLLEAEPGIEVRGLHCHICPPRRRPELYGAMAQKIVDVACAHLATPPSCINLGGGFFSKMPASLRERWPYPIPTFEEYAEAMGSVMAARFGKEGGPELILEPGIAIVADAMSFVCRVHSIKTLHGKSLAVLTGSVYNTKPTKNDANLPMVVVPSGEQTEVSGQTYDLTGYTCMEDDVMFRGYEGPLTVGDFVRFENVGAYTIVLKPPFILPAPPMLTLDDGSDLSILRRGETVDDVLATYTFGA